MFRHCLLLCFLDSRQRFGLGLQKDPDCQWLSHSLHIVNIYCAVFQIIGFAFGINLHLSPSTLSFLEDRLSALSQPRQTPRQTSRGVEDGMLFSVVWQGKYRPTVQTQDHQDKWKESKVIKWYKTHQDILTWSYMYVSIRVDILMYTVYGCIWPIVRGLTEFVSRCYTCQLFVGRRGCTKRCGVWCRCSWVFSMCSHRKVQFFQWHHEDLLRDGEKMVRSQEWSTRNNSFAVHDIARFIFRRPALEPSQLTLHRARATHEFKGLNSEISGLWSFWR